MDWEGLVPVVAVGVASAVACLSFEYISAVPLVSSSSLERKSLSVREGGANLAVPIGTATRVNISVNIDLCFTLSCELVGRLPNIKRWKFSTVHIPDVEGLVGEVRSVSWGGARTKGDRQRRELTKNMFLHSDLLTSLTSSPTPLFFMIGKLVLRTNEIKI